MDIKKTASAGIAAVGAVAATVGVKKIKEKTFCPLCSAKKIIGKITLSQKTENPYGNGSALTPPMGWSSWNLFRNKISEDLIKEIADAMDKSGLREAGYIYVNIDDCWQASTRDNCGRLQWDRITFPGGIKALSEYVNTRGLKLGIYSSNGHYTCEDYPASLLHERIDAETFAEWGIEYFKYDFCHNEAIPSLAPKIIAISLAEEGSGVPFVRLTAKDMELRGLARIVPDETIDDKCYIDGLDSNSGSILFSATTEKAGEYILNLDIRKSGGKDKFIIALINSHDEYHIYSASRKNWTPEGKLQVIVHLEEGTNTVKLYNPVASRMDSAAIQYKLMGRELKRATKIYAEKNGVAEKPIVYSLCEWGMNRPWKWGAEAGNLWRTTPDIGASWISLIGIYEHNVRLWKYAAKGAWNDPDMLEVGNGNLTLEENRAHFSLWCMMAAPLILGNDIRKFIREDGTIDSDNEVYRILTNKDMISIDQDSLGVQCRRIKNGMVDVLVKPLEGNRIAVCVLNKGKSETSIKLSLKKFSNLAFVSLPEKEGYTVYDIWEKKYQRSADEINAVAPSHGVKVYVIE